MRLEAPAQRRLMGTARKVRVWPLGHAGLATTMRYARADIDLKCRALAQAFPDAIAPPPDGRLLLDGADLVSWMRRL